MYSRENFYVFFMKLNIIQKHWLICFYKIIKNSADYIINVLKYKIDRIKWNKDQNKWLRLNRVKVFFFAKKTNIWSRWNNFKGWLKE